MDLAQELVLDIVAGILISVLFRYILIFLITSDRRSELQETTFKLSEYEILKDKLQDEKYLLGILKKELIEDDVRVREQKLEVLAFETLMHSYGEEKYRHNKAEKTNILSGEILNRIKS